MSEPRRRIELLPVIAAILIVASFSAAGLFHTWLRIEGLRIGYAISQATSEQRVLQRENERLHLEVATLEAPARIERIARQELGMRAPGASEVTVVREPANAPTKVARRDTPAAVEARGDG
ncbi:MAG: cell division protein FtsL [Deltaproteobacteria bacterium]|nr:cell division protein FtsL [Deltaproteobacteria bacterium]